MNWHIARDGVESCLRKQNHVVEKFYAKPKVFGLIFAWVHGLNIKCEFVAMLSLMKPLHVHNNSSKLTVIYLSW